MVVSVCEEASFCEVASGIVVVSAEPVVSGDVVVCLVVADAAGVVVTSVSGGVQPVSAAPRTSVRTRVSKIVFILVIV